MPAGRINLVHRCSRRAKPNPCKGEEPLCGERLAQVCLSLCGACVPVCLSARLPTLPALPSFPHTLTVAAARRRQDRRRPFQKLWQSAIGPCLNSTCNPDTRWASLSSQHSHLRQSCNLGNQPSHVARIRLCLLLVESMYMFHYEVTLYRMGRVYKWNWTD